MDCRVGLHDVFSGVREGNDVEFLEALRRFLDRSKRYTHFFFFLDV